jgi:hypothetical protein
LRALPSEPTRRLAPASGEIARESDAGGGPIGDPLSDVLRSIRLTGALFFLVDAAPPWRIALPDGKALAPAVLPRAQHIISYHVVREGTCWGHVRGHPPVRLHAGDILVLPRGDAYAMSMAQDERDGPGLVEVMAFMREMAAGRLPFVVREGGAGPDRLRLVCGFLGCDVRPFNPLCWRRSRPSSTSGGTSGPPTIPSAT